MVASVELLDGSGIDYAVTGSFASAHHGHVRATEDVDISVAVEDLQVLEELSTQLPPGTRRVDATTWAFAGGALVELYPVTDELDRIALDGRVGTSLPDDGDRIVWVVPLEALLVLKVREHVRHGHGLKHIADVQALLARNADTLDVEELERLLALDPAWEETWDQLVEPG